jgi:hypothetical protein
MILHHKEEIHEKVLTYSFAPGAFNEFRMCFAFVVLTKIEIASLLHKTKGINFRLEKHICDRSENIRSKFGWIFSSFIK